MHTPTLGFELAQDNLVSGASAQHQARRFVGGASAQHRGGFANAADVRLSSLHTVLIKVKG